MIWGTHFSCFSPCFISELLRTSLKQTLLVFILNEVAAAQMIPVQWKKLAQFWLVIPVSRCMNAAKPLTLFLLGLKMITRTVWTVEPGCVVIQVAYEQEDHYHSVQWMEESVRLFRGAGREWSPENEGTLEDALDHLAFSSFKVGGQDL